VALLYCYIWLKRIVTVAPLHFYRIFSAMCQSAFLHTQLYYLRILIKSYLATFLDTNSLSVLMCHKAVNQSSYHYLFFNINIVDFYRLLSAISVSINYLFLIFCVFSLYHGYHYWVDSTMTSYWSASSSQWILKLKSALSYLIEPDTVVWIAWRQKIIRFILWQYCNRSRESRSLSTYQETIYILVHRLTILYSYCR